MLAQIASSPRAILGSINRNINIAPPSAQKNSATKPRTPAAQRTAAHTPVGKTGLVLTPAAKPAAARPDFEASPFGIKGVFQSTRGTEPPLVTALGGGAADSSNSRLRQRTVALRS